MIAKARARGESHGLTDIFLSAFIERELILVRKWAAGRDHKSAPGTRRRPNRTASTDDVATYKTQKEG
jgi:hypothetical protein